jgi:membrane protease YdiL (CAAX protease family)
MRAKPNAGLALLLLVPAPSIGAAAGMIWWPGTALGAAIFSLSKLWLVALPLVWHRWVDRQPLSFSPARRGGFGMAALSGGLISLIILAAYLLAGSRLIDRPLLAERLAAIGMASPYVYVGGALYWILVNSVMEEYVWRWFCVRKAEALLRPVPAALFAATCFTAHHVVALHVYLKLPALVLCSLGVFVGGATWSLLYVRYRSIWPCYVSHAMVDLAIFGIGAALLFG